MQEDQLQEGGGRSLFTPKNFIILFLGFILGYFIKLQAVQTITMGYDDYKLSQWKSNFKKDISKDSILSNKDQSEEGSVSDEKNFVEDK